MGKKKKMTPAQAAAARREGRPRRVETTVKVKDDGPRDRTNRLILVVTIALVAVIAVASLVFTLGTTA